MKNYLLLVCLFITTSQIAKAQWNPGTLTDPTYRTGNVGIGTSTPSEKLHVNGGAIMSADATWGSDINIRLDGQFLPALRLTRYMGAAGYYSNASFGIYFDNTEYALALGIGSTTTGDKTVTNKALVIRQNGNVGIGLTGTNVPDAKLAVNGIIHSVEVRVTPTVPGPDYVFAKDYHLPSLETVKAYVEKNHHLPEVPSAKEFEADGVKVGEMNMLLLKKIEEMTLYMIEMKKEIEELKAKK